MEPLKKRKVVAERKVHKEKATKRKPITVEKSEDLDKEVYLPKKFSFGIKKPITVEKSDHEKELDQLWAEFHSASNASENGSFGSSPVDTEDTNVPDTETDPSTLCSQGKHQVILDKTIGMRCRFCSFVELEIKYILPP